MLDFFRYILYSIRLREVGITMKKTLFLFTIFCWASSQLLFAQQKEFLGKESTYLEGQSSKEVTREGKILDETILQLNDRLKRYVRLKNTKIKYMPEKSIFSLSQNGDFIEIDQYSFIPRRDKFNTSQGGMHTQQFRLYFNGNNLSKVETITTTVNYNTLRIQELSVIDPSPLTEDTSDITIQRYTTSIDLSSDFDGLKPSRFTLGDYQNTVARPKRNQFKKYFYILNLRRIDRLYERTEEFQIKYADNTKDKVLGDLEDSLEVVDPRKTRVE